MLFAGGLLSDSSCVFCIEINCVVKELSGWTNVEETSIFELCLRELCC